MKERDTKLIKKKKDSVTVESFFFFFGYIYESLGFKVSNLKVQSLICCYDKFVPFSFFFFAVSPKF